MKITSIKLVTPNQGVFADLSLRKYQGGSPYILSSATGLDASDILTQYNGNDSLGGSGLESYYQMGLAKRELALKISLNPDYSANFSYSDLRDNIYRLVSVSRTSYIDILLMNNMKVQAKTSGFIVKVETSHFSSTPDITLTISCTDPMFRAPNSISVPASSISASEAIINDHISTAPHGLSFSVKVLDDAGLGSLTMIDPVILNSSTNFDINEHTMWVFSLLPTSPWITNDVITVNSDIKKSVSYTRLTVNGLVTIGLADSIAQDSNWPIMFPGENRFCFQESNYLEFVSFEYTPAFWGV